MHRSDAQPEVRRAFGCDTAFYVADDDTDEDAFTSGGQERLLSIRPDMKPASMAQYRLGQQTDIERVLNVPIETRRRQE